MEASDTRTTTPRPRAGWRRHIGTVVLCWLFVVFDGYDLIVYGTVVPGISREWGIDAGAAGLIGSLAFLGMIVGALLGGRLCDTLGRKRVLLGGMLVFSLTTAACAVAGGPAVFGTLRLLAGLGLGALIVAANALLADITPDRLRPVVATVLMSGVPAGGSIAAVLGIGVIPTFGWRWMFAPALLPVLVLLPLGIRYLRESVAAARGTAADPGYATILRPPLLVVSLLFSVAVAATFVTWYGLGTWLPGILQRLGYGLVSALTLVLALNLGAIVGSVFTAWAGSRFGAVRAAAGAMSLTGCALFVMSTGPTQAALYPLVVVAGMGAHGTSCLVTAAVAAYYPPELRGTAMGWAIGTGRVGAVLAPTVTGLILSSGGGPGGSLIFFAVCGVVAAAFYLLLSRWPAARREYAPAQVQV
jgi:AAHS family benzoate transporter-like MFS transporter